MGGGRCGEAVEPEEGEEDYDPSDRGPNTNRGCTDILCLLLLVVFCATWLGVAGYAFSRGNPYQLLHPSNSNGEICGRGDQAGKPNLLFFDLSRCVRLSAALAGCPTPQVCVATCPDFYWSYVEGAEPRLGQFCTGLAPGELDSASLTGLVKGRRCPAYLLPSKSFLGRCVPTFGLVRTSSNLTRTVQRIHTSEEETLDEGNLKEGIDYLMKVIDLRSYGEKFLADLANYWWIVLLALLLASILSFGWIVLMRFAAGPVIGISIGLCILLLVGTTAFSFYKYATLSAAGVEAVKDDIFLPPVVSSLSGYYYNKNTWLGLGIVVGALTLVILFMLLFLCQRIIIAIQLIEEASKAIGSMMSTLVFPIGPFLLQGLVIIWFMLVASFLATAGDKEYRVVDGCREETCRSPDTQLPFVTGDTCLPGALANCTACPTALCVFHKFGPRLADSWLQGLNFFGLFWLLFFVEALGEMVMAGAFAGWYWTMDKEGSGSQSGLGPSLYRTCRYHLGTLAFGSLVLSVVRMVRVLLEYVEAKLKEYELQDNYAVKFVTCCCRCCMWCLEKFIRYMNRNAYIMTAVYGYSFCRAGSKSFNLLIKNFVRAGTLDKVTDFILFIGKIIVVSIVALVTFSAFSNAGTDSLEMELNFRFVPMVVIILGAYAIASSFFSVYSMAVDTIFLCFLEDLDKHKGGPYYMSEDLKQILELPEDPEPEAPLEPLEDEGSEPVPTPI
jgi:choline transporter-like protein 2/4/5